MAKNITQEQLKTQLLTTWIKESFFKQVEQIMDYNDDLTTQDGKADWILAESIKVNVILDRVESVSEVVQS